MDSHDDSNYLHKEACTACGSKDNKAVYSDGHSYCFGCLDWQPGDQVSSPGKLQAPKSNDQALRCYLDAAAGQLRSRSITAETCKKYGYKVGTVGGSTVQLAPYYKEGTLAGLKVRGPDKAFSTLGDMKSPTLFGSQLIPATGKMLVVTEGEIDCLSVAQVLRTWPVVSLPSGAHSAAKAFKNNLELLCGYETVVLFFDSDEPGQTAAKECAELLPPGKAKIASIQNAKDASDLLQQGRVQEIVRAVWDAKEYRPDGLVSVADLMPELDKPIVQGLPWFLDELTKITFGRRQGEVYGFGAGTGIGKTDVFTQQIEYDINTLGLKVGLIFLEQKPLETVIRVAGKAAGKRFHVPDGTWTPEERKAVIATLQDKIILYDSFGQTDWGVVANKIRFMAASEGIKVFYLDHLTAMADTADERGSLEQIMKEMAGLANELQVIIHFISHLTTPEGKPHEEGGKVSIRHFKGSRAIGFWSYYMFGLERNQQAESESERSTTVLRVLKDRFTGQATGHLLYLGYDPVTGRLFPSIKPSEGGPKGFADETNSKDF